MRIVNASNSVKTFFTNQGHVVRVKAGEISEVFVPDGTIINSILKHSSTQVAMVLEDEYDYRVQKMEAPAAANGGYVYTSIAQAKAKMLEGRDFTQVNNPNEVLNLKTEIDARDTEIDKLKKEISELNIKIEQGKLEIEPLTKKNIELNKDIIKIKSDNENLVDVNNSLREKSNKLNKENAELIQVKASLEMTINSCNETIAKKDKDIDLLKSEGKSCLETNEKLRKILNDIVTFYEMEEIEPEVWRIPKKKRSRKSNDSTEVSEVPEVTE